MTAEASAKPSSGNGRAPAPDRQGVSTEAAARTIAERRLTE